MKMELISLTNCGNISPQSTTSINITKQNETLNRSKQIQRRFLARTSSNAILDVFFFHLELNFGKQLLGLQHVIENLRLFAVRDENGLKIKLFSYQNKETHTLDRNQLLFQQSLIFNKNKFIDYIWHIVTKYTTKILLNFISQFAT